MDFNFKISGMRISPNVHFLPLPLFSTPTSVKSSSAIFLNLFSVPDKGNDLAGSQLHFGLPGFVTREI